MAKIKYRLGLDLGTNSLGWCVYRLNENDEPTEIVRMGSRVFSDGRDPKSLASLAADRRKARQARRRRDRVLKRRQRLLNALVRYRLLPEDEAARKQLQTLDPYVLRARGLDDALSPHELGRALYHLTRKRGFKSSRKEAADAESEKETGKVKEAIARLRAQIEDAGCRTVGEYLARQHEQRKPVRARRSADGQYVLYLQRDMVEEEFDRLWDVQRRHHPELLTEQAREHLKDILLFQRRLLPVKPGRCLFEQDEYRLPLCAPLQQKFRILQELNNLRVKDGVGYRPLTLEERNRMLEALSREKGQLSFAKLGKVAGLGKAAAFNLESEKRKGLKGDSTTANFSDPEIFGDAWFTFDPLTQEALALLVERADQNDSLIQALLVLPAGLDRAGEVMRPHPHEHDLLQALGRLPRPINDAQARAIARIRLPPDFGSLSRKALERIVPELEREVITYDVAVQRAGYQHHSQLHTGEFFEKLPYYGEVLRGYTTPAEKAGDEAERMYGKIPNPTVHIGLNQLRQLVNALIRRYGHPHQIVIELTREFGLSGDRRREIEREQADNQRRNERYDAELITLGQPPNRENRIRLRLWEELGEGDALDRYCVYSGQRLSKAMLFSGEVEIDHVLPFSKSLHDGIGNKILCARQANRDKGNRAPFEAFGHSPPGYDWNEIMARVERLFANSKNPALRRKAELFREDALEIFLQGKDFLDRHLTDTAYLSRAAKQYLSYICHKDHVWVSSGKLTGMLRGKWGLNTLLSSDSRKNRNDHRHHALDAGVIGLCSRSLIQRMATAAARAEARGESRLLENLELPWPRFREELAECLRRVVVSHKPEHGVQSAIHKETNYGLRKDANGSEEAFYCAHVPIESINFSNVAPPTGKRGRPSPKVRDAVLREQLAQLLDGKSERECKELLSEFSRRTGIRRVQIQQRLAVVIPIHTRDGKPYRYVIPEENYCRDIILDDKGRWTSEIVNSFEANRADFNPNKLVSKSGRSVVARLRKGDLVAIDQNGVRRIMRVASFTNDGVALAEHFEANTADRDAKHVDGYSYLRISPEPLRKLKARVVGVDILGYVNDPGFKE